MSTYLFFRLKHAGPQFHIEGLSSEEAKRVAPLLAKLVDCGCCTVSFRETNEDGSARGEKWDYTS